MFLYSTKLQERHYYERKSLAPITTRCTNICRRQLTETFLTCSLHLHVHVPVWPLLPDPSIWGTVIIQTQAFGFILIVILECRFTYKLCIQGSKFFSWSYGSVGTLEVWWIEPCLWGGLSKLITIVAAIMCRVRTENGCVLGIRAPIQGGSWAQDPNS